MIFENQVCSCATSFIIGLYSILNNVGFSSKTNEFFFSLFINTHQLQTSINSIHPVNPENVLCAGEEAIIRSLNPFLGIIQ